ncbi:CLUMA_CG016217, isoform A [Clunio marinus]|uniref:CLUMA_CG016217, isoform A n=1 Tax=Clunio marinus TaxID=568069 RepID=A0A1J1IUA0_9DIPT|nr:CLUMA_CG016217, isoform A [Clunio marinus]
MAFVLILLLAIAVVYLLNQYLFSYWSKRGIKQLEPSFFYGDGGDLIKFKKSMGEFFKDIYSKHKNERIVGVYISYKPVLVVTDPKLVQDILIRDFTTFHDRPMPVDENKDPISGHLFNIGGQKWRDLRVKLSPTFTSGKIKAMYPIIKNVGKVLEDYLDEQVNKGVNVFEFRDLMARFNINIISSVAFGIDNDCINEPKHFFRQMSAKIFDPNLMNGLRALITLLAPTLFHKLNMRILDRDVEDFIFSVVKQTVEYREQKNFSRNDFMQLLIQLKNQGYVSVDKGEKDSEEMKNHSDTKSKLTLNEIIAQAFVFFVAGFETSSSTLLYCLFELARHKEIQQKVQQEVDKVFKTSGPDGVTYDMLSELKYLECVIDETLRKYPILPVHVRTANRDYKIADSNIVIPKGASLWIPALGFHRDPDIYENPLEFKPERFLNSSNGDGKATGVFYTPFGDGPRNCIGMRLGKLTTKIGLSIIFSKFNLELNDKEMQDGELKFHPNQFVLTPSKLFNMKISRR